MGQVSERMLLLEEEKVLVKNGERMESRRGKKEGYQEGMQEAPGRV